MQVLRRDKHLCRCGRRATEVDHVIPAWRGGSDGLSNLVSMCYGCHREKTIREAVEAREFYANKNRRRERLPGRIDVC